MSWQRFCLFPQLGKLSNWKVFLPLLIYGTLITQNYAFFTHALITRIKGMLDFMKLALCS